MTTDGVVTDGNGRIPQGPFTYLEGKTSMGKFKSAVRSHPEGKLDEYRVRTDQYRLGRNASSVGKMWLGHPIPDLLDDAHYWDTGICTPFGSNMGRVRVPMGVPECEGTKTEATEGQTTS